MSDQYKVDLSELEGVVSRLKSLERDMDGPVTKVKYSTAISKTALGTDFGEADELYAAHDTMQTYMSETLEKLQEFIRVFGKKTETAHNSYTTVEHETRSSMNS